ncbi:MAG TPA: DUF1573 domain-containing protein [Fimbriimonadaceae bacterium]|nr:DUF1573 domain-containing protein [Fimbriimonadaceae bacterium]
MLSAVFMVLALQGPDPKPIAAPVPPAGLNEHYYQKVQAVVAELAGKNFLAASREARGLPKVHLRVHWDDSAVPASQRAEYVEARDRAFGAWKRFYSAVSFTIARESPDLRFSFAPTLPPSAAGALPPGAVHFFSDGVSEPRLETVIALARGEGARRTEANEVHNEVSYAVSAYFGLVSGPVFGPANSRTDQSTFAWTTVLPGHINLARGAVAVAEELRKRIEEKVPLIGGAPQVELDPAAYTARPILQGEKIDFVVQISNVGASDLLVRAEPDCGCLSVQPSLKVEAGTSQLLRARLDSTEFVGDLRKRIFIYTNDPERHFIEIPVRVQVEPRFRLLSPVGRMLLVGERGASFDVFLAVEPGAGIEPTEVTLDGLPGTVRQERWSGEIADPELGEPARPRSGYKFSIELAGDVPPGRHASTLQIATSHPQFPVLRYTVQAQKGIVALPIQVYFGEVRHAKRAPLLLSRPGVPFKILKIESSHPNFKAEFGPEEAAEHRVAVQYDGRADAGDVSATLTVHTSDPSQPKVLVPLRAVVR